MLLIETALPHWGRPDWSQTVVEEELVMRVPPPRLTLLGGLVIAQMGRSRPTSAGIRDAADADNPPPRSPSRPQDAGR